MEIIVVVGSSAVGKKTFIDAVLDDRPGVRDGLGLALAKGLAACGCEFGWPFGCWDNPQMLVENARIAGTDVLLLKHQNKYKREGEYKYLYVVELAVALASIGGKLRVVLLSLPGSVHVERYWAKHGHNEPLRQRGDSILKFIDAKDSEGAAKALVLSTERWRSQVADLLTYCQTSRNTVLFEVRDAGHFSYPLINDEHATR